MEFQQSTGSLDFTTKKEEEFFYFVEWSKVQNVEQMVLILQAMGFGISSKHVHFESIKEFLNLDYPVRTQ
jgi:hypothetical protein